jgi:hypothetical protein
MALEVVGESSAVTYVRILIKSTGLRRSIVVLSGTLKEGQAHWKPGLRLTK